VIGSTKVESSLFNWSNRGRSRVGRAPSLPQGREITVLVADDNDSYRSDLVEFLLKQPGIRVVGEARDGDEILALAAELSPDLVILDVSTRGMNGFEATEKIKNLHPQAKVVFTTIHEKQTYQVLSEYFAADGFICKSFAKREIPRLLRRLGLGVQGRGVRTEK